MNVRVYTPNRWTILEIADKEGNVTYRVFGGWSGGYLDGDSWRLSSPIELIEIDDDDIIHFSNSSGSIYDCHKTSEGFTGYMTQVLPGLQAQSKSFKIRAITFEDYQNEKQPS